LNRKPRRRVDPLNVGDAHILLHFFPVQLIHFVAPQNNVGYNGYDDY
jgi:hypothetical protein